jgi:hypothetical protein
MHSSSVRRFFLALILAASFFEVSVFAKNASARVIGTVTDPPGAGGAGATIPSSQPVGGFTNPDRHPGTRRE